ncbi:MAG: hypothetical protein KAU14_08885 [Thermoplasmata archaeon]|nr:hypothetical protein [Thermoplasmata archaeon]
MISKTVNDQESGPPGLPLRSFSFYGSLIIDACILVLLGYSVLVRNFRGSLISVGSLVVVLLPILLSSRLEIRLPTGFEFLWSTALLTHQVGVVLSVYGKIAQWDMVTHFYTFAILSYMYFCFSRLLDRLMPPHTYHALFIITLTILATVTSGVIWEFLEFSQDQLFDTNTQPSVVDTMQDLILDILGGLTMAIILIKGTKDDTNPLTEGTEHDLMEFFTRKGIIDKSA